MELKKNPKYDINRYRAMFLTVGMICSLSVVIMAFQWTTTARDHPTTVTTEIPFDMVYTIPRTVIEPAKPKVKPMPMKAVDVHFVESEKLNVSLEAIAPAVETIHMVATVVDVIPEAPDTTTLIFSEIAPQPVGGFNSFYSILKDNMKYPRQAQNRDVEGRVFVQFVVDKDGSLTNMHVVKGIGSGCDEEAMRVVKLTKWTAGRQSGKAVKVKMTQPIIFKMTHSN